MAEASTQRTSARTRKTVTVRSKSSRSAGCFRVIVISYLFLLVIWPVALVAQATFAAASVRCWKR